MSEVRDTNMNFEDFVDFCRRMSTSFDLNTIAIDEIKKKIDNAFVECMYHGNPKSLMDSVALAAPKTK